MGILIKAPTAVNAVNKDTNAICLMLIFIHNPPIVNQLFKAEELQAELAELDTEKAKEIALKQAKNIKAKAEELYRYAIEKSTPVVEKAADEVRKQSLKVVKEIEKNLEDEKKSKK